MKLLRYIKAQAGKIKQNMREVYMIALLTLALPALGYIYGDWRSSLTVFVAVQLVLAGLWIKYGDNK